MGDKTECKMSTFNEISEDSVFEYIKEVSQDKSTVNDLVPTKIYKSIITRIIKQFTHIINISLKHGTMPDICKKAMVTPIYKSGDLN